MLFAAAGFGMAVWVVAEKIWGPTAPQGWASILSVVLIVGGIQLIILGVIGEYLGRVYDEIRRRPLYIVKSQVGLSEPLPEGDEVSAGQAAVFEAIERFR
jgi:hypothetical protein